MKFTATVVLWIVAAFYAYGALVHVANMASLTGFDWLTAPLKWQMLDVAYLVLDVIVAAGLGRQWRTSVFGFFGAAVSQIALYTIGRSWILDVPERFRPGQEAVAYLNHLVAFHVVTFVTVSVSLAVLRSRRA